MKLSQAQTWKQAKQTEIKSLKDNKVWDLVKLHPERKTVGSNSKLEQMGKSSDTRQGWLHRDSRRSNLLSSCTLRVLLALSAQYGLKLHQVDVTTTFLYGNLEEEVYMAQPVGFVSKGKESLVCKLSSRAFMG